MKEARSGENGVVFGMNILGLASESHDSGLALVKDGAPLLMLEEERLNREKHTQTFPALSLAAAFGEGRADFEDVEVITTPWDVDQLRRTFFSAVMGHFPLSLALALPGAETTQDPGIVFLNTWLRRDLKRQFRKRPLPPHRQRRASQLARVDLLRLSVRRGDGHRDGRLR